MPGTTYGTMFGGVLRGSLSAAMGLVAAMGLMAMPMRAQTPTDASALASPTTAPPKAAVVDGSVQASPEPGATKKKSGMGSIAVGTALPIKLAAALDSGKLKNGQTLEATLTAAVRAGSATVPAGTKVKLSVVEAVPANKIASAGEMSLQVVSVGAMSVFTDTQTFRGKEGHKDVADSAPAPGTDATLAAGAALTFHVQPDPTTTMPGVVK